MGFPGGARGKEPPTNAGEVKGWGWIPGSGRSHVGANGNPLQYSCLENPMDREAWGATAHGVAKRRTWLSDFTFTFNTFGVWETWQVYRPFPKYSSLWFLCISQHRMEATKDYQCSLQSGQHSLTRHRALTLLHTPARFTPGMNMAAQAALSRMFLILTWPK